MKTCLKMFLFLIFIVPAKGLADVPEIGDTVCVYGCGDTGSSSGSGGSWGWSGWNPNSEPSGSSSSGGGWVGNGSSTTYVDPDPGGLKAEKKEAKYRKKQAEFAFQGGHWEDAVDHANRCMANSSMSSKVNAVCARIAALASYHWDLEHYGVSDYTGLSMDRLEYHIYNYEVAHDRFPDDWEINGTLQGLKERLQELKNRPVPVDPISIADKHYQNGSDAYNAGNFEEAASSFRETLNWNPNDHEAYKWWGWSLVKLERREDAANAFRGAIEKGSTDSGVFIRLTDILRNNDATREEALTYALRIQEMEPNNVHANQVTARVLSSLGRRDEAAVAYDKALSIEPSNVVILEGAMMNAYINEDPSNTLRLIERLESVDPENSWASHYRSKLKSDELKDGFFEKYENSEVGDKRMQHFREYRDALNYADETEELEKALAQLKDARAQIKADPTSAEGYRAESKALVELWRFEDASDVMDKAVAREPNNFDVLNEAIAHDNRLDNYRRAFKRVERLEHMRPGNQATEMWIKSLVEDVVGVSAHAKGIEAFDLFDPSLTPEFKKRVIDAGIKEIDNEMKFFGNPIYQEMKDILLAESEALAKQGEKAIKADSLDQAKEEAMMGFDTALKKDPSAVTAKEVPKGYIEVPEAKRTPEIRSLEAARSEVYSKKNELATRLLELKNAPDRDDVEVARVKQELSNLDNAENFLNFSIEEKLRLGDLKDSAINAQQDIAPEDIAPEEPEPDVTEMSVGGIALTKDDQERSEKLLAEKRKQWEKDTKKAVIEYIERGMYYSEVDRRVIAEIAADPKLKEAVEKSDRLWKQAEEEYERRQNDVMRLPEEEPLEFFGAEKSYARKWPGEENPDLPLPNPLEEDKKKFKAVSKIYGEYMERERLLSIFEDSETDFLLEMHDQLDEDLTRAAAIAKK